MTKYAAQPGIYLNELGGLQVVYPSLDEQTHIVTHVDNASSPLIAAISRLEREIELLHEYRTRLIADAVTGKFDVREAATKLPIEVEPATTKEDTSLDVDAELVDEECLV